MKKINRYITTEEALAKLQKYCAYQDRCHQEVRTKLLKLGIYGDSLESIMVDLITENFLNEERFAKSYARGKFRIKHWGRIRIKQELKLRNISVYCIKKAMQEIEEEDYLLTIRALLKKKNKSLKEANLYQRKNKLARYLLQKGFETGLIWEQINVIKFS